MNIKKLLLCVGIIAGLGTQTFSNAISECQSKTSRQTIEDVAANFRSEMGNLMTSYIETISYKQFRKELNTLLEEIHIKGFSDINRIDVFENFFLFALLEERIGTEHLHEMLKTYISFKNFGKKIESFGSVNVEGKAIERMTTAVAFSDNGAFRKEALKVALLMEWNPINDSPFGVSFVEENYELVLRFLQRVISSQMALI